MMQPDPSPVAAPLPFVPEVRLFTEHVQVDVGSYVAPEFEDQEAPALSLAFRYGAARVPASADERESCFIAEGGCMVRRDLAAEKRMRAILESMGAVECACAEHVELPFGSRADYLVFLDQDVHARCGFVAYALPQLRALGFAVEVDPGYRWQALADEAPWYASLLPDEDPDWFSLELGVEIEGRRLNLLPALLELLEGSRRLDTLLDRRRRCLALPLDDGRFLAVPPRRLALLAQVIRELYGARRLGERLRVPASEVMGLASLDEVLGSPGEAASPRSRLRWRGAAPGMLERAMAVAAPPQPVALPEGLQATLRPYQHEGLRWLQHLSRHGASGVLADEMGLGKTLQTIAHLLCEHRAGSTRRPSLIVVPTSLVYNWQRELRRFAPQLRVTVYHGPRRGLSLGDIPLSDIVITTYPILTRDLVQLSPQPFHLVILDEAQTIKNNRSQVHRAVRTLEAAHRLCLSGTPLENSLGELWSLFDFLMPGYLGDRQQFGERYAVPIENEGNEQALASLRRRVAPFILRRAKEQVATELPPKTELVRAVELHGDQRELYESIRIAAHAQVRHAIAERGLSRSTVAILDALMKLRQVCCDPRLVRMEAARQVTESAKYDLLFELLPKQLELGRKVLLFSQFTSMLALISDGLKQRHIRHVVLTGSTVDRQRPIREFGAGFAEVFLISLKAGGTGLNLTRADTVIHYDPWWNPAAQAQATDRAHRIGQQRPVFVYNLIVAGSVEERMLRLQERKRALARSLLTTGDGGPGVDFTLHELDHLFRPLSDEDPAEP